MENLRQRSHSWQLKEGWRRISRLKNLPYIDFEELCRDLAQAETGKRFAAFGPGPENAIKAHIDLVTIHPFSDGNGRTSRLLMNLILMRGGYPPMVISPEDRPDYIDSLEKAQLAEDQSDYQAFMLDDPRASLDQYLDFLREKDRDPTADTPQP